MIIKVFFQFFNFFYNVEKFEVYIYFEFQTQF